jgi:hypothetical protein
VVQALPHAGGRLLLFNVSLELDLAHDPGASGSGKDAANSLLSTPLQLERSTDQGAPYSYREVAPLTLRTPTTTVWREGALEACSHLAC